MTEAGFDLDKTFVHLGLEPTAVPLPEFRWDEPGDALFITAGAGTEHKGR